MGAIWQDIPATLARGEEWVEELIRYINESGKRLASGSGGAGGTTTNNFSSSSTTIVSGSDGPWYAIPYAATVTPDMANGANQQCTLTGPITINVPTGGTDGKSFFLCLTQDAVGGRAIAFSSNWKIRQTPIGYQEALTSIFIFGKFSGTTDIRVFTLDQGIAP